MTTYAPTTSTSGTETYVTDPLTTIFTPAAWCSNRPYTSTDNGAGVVYYQRDLAIGDTSQYGQLGRTSSCYVPNLSFHRRPNVSGVYSPGVCPLSYTQTMSGASDGTTKVQCCPSGMNFDNVELLPGLCSSTSTVTTPVTVVLELGTTTTITTNFIAVDWPLMVAWQSDNLRYFTPKNAPILARETPLSSRSSSSLSSSSSTPASAGSTPKNPAASKTGAAASAKSDSNSSLSSGAGAGIGVGVAIAVLALIALVTWFCVRRRRKAKRDLEFKNAGIEQSGSGYTSNYEADSSDRYELMPAAPPPQEVDGTSSNRAELRGNWEGHELRTKRESTLYTGQG